MSYTAEQLSDLEEIRRLSAVYARGLDRFDMEEVMQIFAVDSVFDATPVGMEEYKGVDAIRDFFVHNQEVMNDQMHLFGNFVIDLESPTRARGTSYLFQDGHLKSGAQVTTSCLNEDEYEKRDGQWYVVRRACVGLMPMVGNDSYQE
ncbi:nuclear transport factor 2 family protein [Nocardioides sp. HM23]|uniref:nuclear transport factor 2 family protein n=1 Tax=Nocardioides bizhenqiangii TaxID=3095076 RepID=UPI002ACA3C20|nr:nuclear transport factor 2 family protein [Nocardioides sp. HM23]MDZ5621037.1 nuclear transport factor 2 family protein [Nocardioides sp. HM23]